MPLNKRGPYAPTKSMLTVIEKHRKVGLGRLDIERLVNIGITEALAPRTMQSSVLLGFYDADGNVTPEFGALQFASEQDFKRLLAEILRSAYQDVLENLDLATATATDIENAFRGFTPTGQLPRMVQLFVGLMTYVGEMPDGAGKKPTGPRPAAPTRPKIIRKKPTVEDPKRDLPPPPADDSGSDGYSVTVDLGAAGELTFVARVNPLLLSRADRDFFYGLVDAINERRVAQTPPPNPDADANANEVSTP